MTSDDQKNQPLANHSGITQEPVASANPFGALDDLMQVVEALCPTYPERELFLDTAIFRL